MSIHISKHSQGILLAATGDAINMSVSSLRQLLHITVTPLARNRFIVPFDLAYLLLERFPVTQANWAPDLLIAAQMQAVDRSAQLQAQAKIDIVLENPDAFLGGYDLAQKLDAHQLAAVAVISIPELRGMSIFDEQGTGKTVMGLCGFDRLKQTNLVDKLIVIAPKSVLGGWEKDAIMLFGNKYRIVLITAHGKEKRKQLMRSHDILAISYETAVSELPLIRTILSVNKNYMLVVDESYYVKNQNAQRSKAVSDLRKVCSRALVLCGTPAPNSPRDIVQQINIADNGIAFQNIPVSADDDDAAFSAVAKGLENAIYLRRLKHDVLADIPAKNIERIGFALQPIQRKLYETALDEVVLAARNVDDTQFQKQLSSFMARQTALLQICSHPGALDIPYEETPGKQLAIDELLHELIEKNGEKVVIWSYFRYSIQALAERYARYGVVRIDGTVTEVKDRISAIDRFQHDEKTKIFLGNAAAAGAGITLTSAHHAIYESFSNQAAHYMQSVDRIHRRGQHQEVTIHILLSENTLEERMFERLVLKEQTGRSLLGDKYDEPLTRHRFLTLLGAEP